MRTFAKVDEEGKIFIPENIRRAADLKKGQLVELRIAGGGKKGLIISARKSTR